MDMSKFVDVAVDKAASTAKMKVKSMLGGDAKKQSKSGGMGGLFPTAGDSGNKEKKGIFGGLISTQHDEAKPGGGAAPAGGASGAAVAGGAGGVAVAGGAENTDFNSAVDELADL